MGLAIGNEPRRAFGIQVNEAESSQGRASHAESKECASVLFRELCFCRGIGIALLAWNSVELYP